MITMITVVRIAWDQHLFQISEIIHGGTSCFFLMHIKIPMNIGFRLVRFWIKGIWISEDPLSFSGVDRVLKWAVLPPPPPPVHPV